MVEEDKKPIQVYAAAAANLVIAISKFIAAGITGSSAMFSEGIHSVADICNQLLMLLGLSRSKKELKSLLTGSPVRPSHEDQRLMSNINELTQQHTELRKQYCQLSPGSVDCLTCE